jgi:hypothetical protein
VTVNHSLETNILIKYFLWSLILQRDSFLAHRLVVMITSPSLFYWTTVSFEPAPFQYFFKLIFEGLEAIWSESCITILISLKCLL